MTDAPVIKVKARVVLGGGAIELRCAECGHVFLTAFRKFAAERPYALAELVREENESHACLPSDEPDREGDTALVLPKEHDGQAH